MSSLDTLKQELINQKQILESKGFMVNTAHQYPSPSEITSAIDNIDSNMAKLSNLAKTLITGEGNQEIYIPTESTYTKIRDYAFYSAEGSSTFYFNNLAIPSNIKSIGNYAFNNCLGLQGQLTLPSSLQSLGRNAFNSCANISGKLTLPETCSEVLQYAFAYCTSITSADVYAPLGTLAIHLFSNCSSLKRVSFHPPCTRIPANTGVNCKALEEVYLGNSIDTISSSTFKDTTSLKFMLIEAETPPTISTSCLTGANESAYIILPYNSLYSYSMTSNYLTFLSRIIAFGDFQEGDALPATTTNFELTWYSNLEDLANNSNPITICPATGRLFASQIRNTEIV